MPDEITEMELTIGNVKSDKTLVVRAIMEPKNGPTATLDNIALKKIRGGSEKAILSNESQEVPWKLTLKIDFNENRSDTQFRFDCVDIPIKQALKVDRFCDALSRGGYLTFEVEKTEEQFGRAKVEPGKFDPPDPQMVQIFEALETIQSKTGVTFTSPQSLSRAEANNIATVAQIVSSGTATMMPPEMNFTVREVLEIFPKFASGNTIAIHHYADEWVSVVLGKKVNLGPVLISCQKLQVTYEERDKVMKGIDSRSQDDLLSVVVTPVEGSSIEAKYVAWLPDTDADAVRNMPFVRTTSLNHLIKLLFDTAVGSTGSFNDEEFMNLLAEAKAESVNEQVVISPLILATEDDLALAFDVILNNIEQEQRTILRAKLVENGWLRDEGARSSATANIPV